MKFPKGWIDMLKRLRANLKSRPLQRIGRYLILSLAIIMATVAAIWGLERFLNKAGGSWNEAIALFSTLALLAVTAIYVYLAYKALRVQERPLQAIRLAAQEQHVQDLIRAITRKGHTVSEMASLFPLEQTDREGAFEVVEKTELTDAASSLNDDLYELVPFLPAGLRSSVTRTLHVLFAASGAHSALCTSILKEQIRSLKELVNAQREGRAPQQKATLEGARSIYYLQERDGVAGKPEWTDVISGELWRKADEALAELRDQADSY